MINMSKIGSSNVQIQKETTYIYISRIICTKTGNLKYNIRYTTDFS